MLRLPALVGWRSDRLSDRELPTVRTNHLATMTERTADLDDRRVGKDARRKLCELHRVRAALWPDRDDPMVMCELVTVVSEIAAAEAELRS